MKAFVKQNTAVPCCACMCVLDIDLHIKNLNSKTILEGSDPAISATVIGASELQGTF